MVFYLLFSFADDLCQNTVDTSSAQHVIKIPRSPIKQPEIAAAAVGHFSPVRSTSQLAYINMLNTAAKCK